MNNSTPPTSPPSPWYKESAMLIVVGVLAATLLSGITILSLALQVDDPLVISDDEYQGWRDEFRNMPADEQSEAATAADDERKH